MENELIAFTKEINENTQMLEEMINEKHETPELRDLRATLTAVKKELALTARRDDVDYL